MINDNTDPRKGLPSCSRAERIFNCTGSTQAEKAEDERLGKDSDPKSADAASGTRIHSVLDGSADESTLVTDEKIVKNECIELAYEVLAEQFGDGNMDGHMDGLQHFKEDRIWYKDEQGKELISGQYDWLVLDPQTKQAVLIDYKTGRGEQEFAGTNMQLRWLAVLVWKVFAGQIEEIVTVLIQPLAEDKEDKVTKCKYTVPTLQMSEKEMLDKLKAAEIPNAPRRAGKWCQYCKAFLNGNCSTAGSLVKKAVEIPQEKINDIPLEDLPSYLDAIPIVEKLCKALKERGKKELGDGRLLGDYYLAQGAKVCTLTEKGALYGHMAEQYGVSPAEFINIVSINIGDIKKVIADKNPDMAPKQINALVDGIKEEFGKTTRKSASLKKRKPKVAA